VSFLRTAYPANIWSGAMPEEAQLFAPKPRTAFLMNLSCDRHNNEWKSDPSILPPFRSLGRASVQSCDVLHTPLLHHFHSSTPPSIPPSIPLSRGLILHVRNWLWHLTLNTGELRRCDRRQFTDWDWAQIEQADPLPGPVEMPSNSNYWLYTSADPDKKWGTFEFRRNLVGIGQIRLSWVCYCIEPESEHLTWKQAIEMFRSESSDYFQTGSVLTAPDSSPWIASIEMNRLADCERRWMSEFHAFYFWYLVDKIYEVSWL
jgi:hypothetical protein